VCGRKKRHLLALICSIFGERRRRSNVLRINARAEKLRLKANYQVREHEKMGIPKKFENSQKFTI